MSRARPPTTRSHDVILFLRSSADRKTGTARAEEDFSVSRSFGGSVELRTNPFVGDDLGREVRRTAAGEFTSAYFREIFKVYIHTLHPRRFFARVTALVAGDAK